VADFLAAHGLMMKALTDHAGVFRPGGSAFTEVSGPTQRYRIVDAAQS
jgi:hypothetical protein